MRRARATPALRWAVCAALSLLIHAAAWWVLHPALGVSGHPRGNLGALTSPSSRNVTTVTKVAAITAAFQPPRHSSTQAQQSPALQPEPERRQHPSPTAKATVAAVTAAVPAAPLNPELPQPWEAQALVATTSEKTSAEDTGALNTTDALFLPVSALDSPPEPQSAIDLEAPEGMPEGTFKAEATLFIDEQGHVLRLRIDQASSTGLPALLEEQVYRTFLAATFSPGQKDGQAVKSQLRIEVEFSTEPPPPPPPPSPVDQGNSSNVR